MNINVILHHVTPISILVSAIRQCYESQDKSDSTHKWIDNDEAPSTYEFVLGPKDKALIETITKDGHGSTLEHINFNFQIKGISRLNLQELARHRMASYSVKSTRYTLKELKCEEEFNPICPEDWDRADKYINFTGLTDIDTCSIIALDNLRALIQSGYTNDACKYALPESYKVDLFWSINARSLQNFLTLRMSKRAHFEIRELAGKVYEQIPEDYKFLFKVE
jgi:thymidylate synthase (FAD)